MGFEPDGDRATFIGRVMAKVGERPWATVSVEDGPTPFSYTVGLVDLVNHPDLVVVGIPARVVGPMIEALVERLRGGRFDGDGTIVERAFGRYAGTSYRVDDEGLDEYGLGEWYPSWHPYEVVQVVWPDRSGQFPWSVKADRSQAASQPLLFRR